MEWCRRQWFHTWNGTCCMRLTMGIASTIVTGLCGIGECMYAICLYFPPWPEGFWTRRTKKVTYNPVSSTPVKTDISVNYWVFILTFVLALQPWVFSSFLAFVHLAVASEQVEALVPLSGWSANFVVVVSYVRSFRRLQEVFPRAKVPREILRPTPT